MRPMKEFWQSLLGRRLVIYLAAAGLGIVAARAVGGAWWGWWLAAVPLALLALGLRRLAAWSLLAAALAVAVIAGGRYLQATATPASLAPWLARNVQVAGYLPAPPRAVAEGTRVIFPFVLQKVAYRAVPPIVVLALAPWSDRLRQGDQLTMVGYLQPPHRATNPGELYRPGDYPATLQVGDLRLVHHTGRVILPWYRLLLGRLRSRALASLQESMPGAYPEQMGALLGSMVLGTDTCPLPRALGESLRRAGVIHIAVVSGTQISLLFLAVYTLGRTRRRPTAGSMSPLPRPGLVLLAAGLALIYVALVGGGESTVRAALMALLVALGFLLCQVPAVADRHPLQHDYFSALAAAGLLLLLVSPASLLVPGAQLSFAAVAGLIYLVPRLGSLTPAWRPWRWLVAGSLAPQLAVAPLLSWHFGAIPIAGLAANVVAVPLAGLLLAGGLAALAAAAVAPPLALAINSVNLLGLEALVRVAVAFAGLSWASPQFLVRSPLLVALYYLLLAAAAQALWQVRRRQERIRSLRGQPAPVVP